MSGTRFARVLISQRFKSLFAHSVMTLRNQVAQWQALDLRMPKEMRAIDRVCLRNDQLFMPGDAAHIVPPAGAKVLNLAVADVRVSAHGLLDFFNTGATERLDCYSGVCLTRVRKIVRFSNYPTALLHPSTLIRRSSDRSSIESVLWRRSCARTK